MFAVLKTGGKQYRVAEGDVLRVERLMAEAGEMVQFNDVMMLGGDTVTIGAPMIAGAAVQADVIDQIKGEKLIHYVKRRRKHSSQRTKGHRQKLTLLRVTSILASGGDETGVKVAVGSGSMTATERAAAKPASNRPKTRSGNAGTTSPAAAKDGTAKADKAEAKTNEADAVEAAPAQVTPDDARDEGMSTAAKIAVAAGAAAATGAAVAAGIASARAGNETKSKPTNLLAEPRGGTADDLKKISGVGPKLEALLHENGVFHFDQILAWSADEVAYMDDQLSFKGRIERDGWIDQAKTFAAEQE